MHCPAPRSPYTCRGRGSLRLPEMSFYARPRGVAAAFRRFSAAAGHPPTAQDPHEGSVRPPAPHCPEVSALLVSP
eukprot:4317764-Prymnesium_polylepis.1